MKVPVLTVAEGRPSDLDEVLALLAASGLGADGVPEHITDFLVARSNGRVVGAAALEDYSVAGLLRSVAVAPDRRDWGLGRYLTHALIERSRRRGHAALYLLRGAASRAGLGAVPGRIVQVVDHYGVGIRQWRVD